MIEKIIDNCVKQKNSNHPNKSINLLKSQGSKRLINSWNNQRKDKRSIALQRKENNQKQILLYTTIQP